MNDAIVGCSAATFKYRYIVDSHMFDRTGKLGLISEGIFTVDGLNPLCRRTQIGREQAHIDEVLMKLPAGIMRNSFQANIDVIDARNLGKL